MSFDSDRNLEAEDVILRFEVGCYDGNDFVERRFWREGQR